MFAKMLDYVAYHFENLSSRELTEFVEDLLAQPLPGPGESFEVNMMDSQKKTSKWQFVRPNEEDSVLEHV